MVDLDGMTAYLARQPDVDAAYLYGSVARGQANVLSDVDIAVLLQPGGHPELKLRATKRRRVNPASCGARHAP